MPLLPDFQSAPALTGGVKNLTKSSIFLEMGPVDWGSHARGRGTSAVGTRAARALADVAPKAGVSLTGGGKYG